MANYLDGKNAAEITHFLKKIGDGSMKNAVLKLLDESMEKKELSKQLANSLKAGKIKNGVIVSLGLLLAWAVLSNKKDDRLKEEDATIEIEKAKEAVSNMTEDEVEELIENSINENLDIKEDKEEDI